MLRTVVAVPIFLAALAGLCLGISMHAWLFAILGLWLLFRLLDTPSWKQRVLRGYVCGIVMFSINLYWTHQFSWPGFALLTLFETIFFAVAGFLTLQHQESSARYRGINFVGAITLAEFVRVRFPFGGLALGSFSQSLADSFLLSVAPVVGELGMVAVGASCAVLLDSALHLRVVRAFKYAVPIVVLVAVGSSIHAVGSDTMKVLIVQPGGTQGVKRADRIPGEPLAKAYRATLENGDQVDVIVWPENIIDIDVPVESSNTGAAVGQMAAVKHAEVASGIVEATSPHRFHNAFVVWNANGQLTDRYEKNKRVPFGEYVPWRSAVSRVADLSEIPYDAYKSNDTPTVTLNNHKAAVAISYEALFSNYVRRGVNAGGEVIVVPTNAASYKARIVPQTQVAAAKIRARENGRWVVQAAPTGISAVINANGQVVRQTHMGESTTITQQVTLYRTITFFTRVGDTLVLIAGLLSVLLAFGKRSTQIDRRARTAKVVQENASHQKLGTTV